MQIWKKRMQELYEQTSKAFKWTECNHVLLRIMTFLTREYFLNSVNVFSLGQSYCSIAMN